MKSLVICAVRDSAVGAYMQPFTAQSRGAAVRAFVDAVNDGSTPMNKHPEDYELFEIGEFNEETGVVTPRAVPDSLARAADVKVAK